MFFGRSGEGADWTEYKEVYSVEAVKQSLRQDLIDDSDDSEEEEDACALAWITWLNAQRG